MRRGDVRKGRDGVRKRAMVTLASENEDSLMVMWGDGLFHGYAGAMPLLRTEGVYRDLINNLPVEVTTIQS